MKRLLELLRDHPWVDATQCARLLGVSAGHTGRLLREAARESYAQHVRVRALVGQGNLYALTDKGLHMLAVRAGVPVEQYAFAHQVERRRLTRTLAEIESYWRVREFLGVALKDSLQGGESWSRSRVTHRYRSRGGNRVLKAQAEGVLIGKEGRPFSFLIEWDRGEVPARAYLDRFGELYQWFRSSEPWAKSQSRPVIILITTTRRRAFELLWLLRQAAARRLEPLLPLYAASADVAFRRGEAVWWKAGSETKPVLLFQGLRSGDAALFSRTEFALKSVTGVIHPGPVILGASMRDLVAGTPKAGEQTAAIQLTLSSRSRHVLRRIAVWPLMNRKELLALTGLARAHLVSVLGELERLKLVRVAEYEGVSRYSLTGVGLKFLADSRGYSPVRYARLRRWPLRPGSKTLSVVALERALVHTTVVREFLVELWQAASQGGRLVVWDEYDARQVVRFGGRQHLFAPDAAGVFRKGEQERAFFLEVDRGTVTPSRMRSKLQAFAAFQRSGVPGGGTALLVLCPDEARAQKILKLARGVGLGGGEKSPVLVTTYALREAHGLTGRIWRQATQPGLRRLF